jgi:hypothetical protein
VEIVRKGRKGERVYFMSTTICEDRLSSHAMNVSGLIEDEGRRNEDERGGKVRDRDGTVLL